MVWNDVVPARRPDVIATPSRREDVAALVREAEHAGQRVAVKSGGHNWLGSSLRDGGILIDLGELAAVDVDRDGRAAWVEPGATHEMLADAIVPHGLAFPIGHCPTVGLGGYLLAGGMGWNLREWGPGCWNVTGADVVLASGDEVFVDEAGNPELFWALRGASAGFPGIVTRFQLALHPLPTIRFRRLAFPVDTLPDLVRWVAHRLNAIGAGLEISLIARPAHPAAGRPAVANVAATAFGDDDAGARSILDRALDDLPVATEPVADSGVVPTQLNDLEGEGGWEEGLRYAADTSWVSAGYHEVGQAVARAMTVAPSPLSRTVLAFGHMPDREPNVAFTRFGELTVNVYAAWDDEPADHDNLRWLRSTMQPIERLADGHYVGETDLLADPTRLTRAYPADKWERLRQIVRVHDPARRFHSFLGVR
jgi:FAD/FMN-containing dehydrogenase